MDWITIAEELTPHLRAGELDYCIQRVSSVLYTMPRSPYHLVLDLDFTNEPMNVAAYFDHFVVHDVKDSNLKALYTETNGFYINPDRWYFEVLGCRSYGGHEDYGWLSECDMLTEKDMTLTGMEALQSVYQRHANTHYWDILSYGGDPEVEQVRIACDFCDLLVVLRFQNLIRRSVPFMKQVHVPIFATSHDYDFIYEILPNVRT